MNHVSVEEVLEVHDLLLERCGGCRGCPGPERLTALLARVQNHEFYGGMTDIFALAAMYWASVSKGRVFINGNKRTAVAVCFMFLRSNGVVPHYRSDLEEAAVKVAANEESVKNFAGELVGDGLISKGDEAVVKLDCRFSKSRLPAGRRPLPFLRRVFRRKL